jgi:hypothetical protein
MNKILATFGVVVGVALLIAIAVIFPFLFIWAINTLFGLTIAYTLETWSAMVLMQIFFGTTLSFRGKK